MKILNPGFDHVEIVCHQIAPRAQIFEAMGFEKLGERTLPHEASRSVLYGQGRIRILLTEHLPVVGAENIRSLALEFLARHSDGICVLAIAVEDAAAAYRHALERGARSARGLRTFDSEWGSVTTAEIFTPGDLRYRLVQRSLRPGQTDLQPALFDEGLVASRLNSPDPLKLQLIDHLTNNVDMGEMSVWTEWYQKIFGFGVTRHFEISTGRTGLTSDVVQSADHKIKVPVNQATEPASQVQEFVTRFGGAGVQHLALLTTDLISTLTRLREKGFQFLAVPHTYYETVPKRVPGVTEDLEELEKLGILLDGEGEGYLLQIFSQEMIGPFFFEFIQRKGNQGFGEGNFRALFEAIERDQVRRGTL